MTHPTPPASPPPPPPPPPNGSGVGRNGTGNGRNARSEGDAASDRSSSKSSGRMLDRLRQRGQARDDASDEPEVDDVAGVPTRRELDRELRQAVETSKRASAIAALAFVEVCQLRDINDVYGPDTGDELLRLAAARLQTIDLPGTKVLRYEGAVLAVVLPSIPNAHGAEATAKFLVELMAPPFATGSEPVSIGSNVGVAVSTDNYETLDDMVYDAFQALGNAHESGPGAWVMHDESKRARHTTRIDDRRLHHALENEEFLLHYQPIMSLSTGALVGVEALIRWTQPGATGVGMLFPHDFLPMLEKSGLIVQVGQWVLEESCRQLAAWTKEFPAHGRMFIGCNIGARQLTDAMFRSGVLRALEKTGIEPHRLCLDLTEEALRFNRFQRETAWASLRDLKEAGVKLGLDDFGTGMASISHLRDFRLDMLRFHRVFVSGLGVAREDEVIIKHITAMAHDLGCVAVAEGVETEKQALALPGLGVDLAQGFHFGRPLTATQVSERLRPADAPVPEDPWDAARVLDS
jgi:diguanylate cyclase (GGDEF)-like protein